MARNIKEELRRDLLLSRRAMGHEEWLLKSGTACEFLMGLDAIRHGSRIHCYVSMSADREVCTMKVLEQLSSERKEVFMPYIDQGGMRVAAYMPGHRFVTRDSGPPVPDPLIISDEVRFDAVIVPLVGADLRGARIGYGKGWYDRFFESLLASGIRPVRIGLCFGFQVLREVPSDPWDQFLDLLVTENGIVNCMSGI
jgi:5-formyltetrahydrofolate cyclo-ligase